MIVLLGATGYIGQAFATELERRGREFKTLSRSEVDYTSFPKLLAFLKETKPEFVVNAAGYTGRPNVDACEAKKADTLVGNTMLPQTIAHACAALDIPWGHVSSGCIFAGARVKQGDDWSVQKDLSTPEILELFHTQPERFQGFVEADAANFSFRETPCSFYSGTKALGEEVIEGIGQNYVWRLRIPFDEVDNSRNYLSKLLRYQKVYQNINSLSHRSDFAKACLDTWEVRAPFGIYNVTNPGAVSTGQVVELIKQKLFPEREFTFWADDTEFYRLGAVTPRSNCILDSSKLLAAGVKMRPVEEAVAEALAQWKPEK